MAIREAKILTRFVAFPLPASTQISGGTSNSTPRQQPKNILSKSSEKRKTVSRERANLPELDDGWPLGLEHGDED
jgi:hypothetical protein